ncbi:TIR domain-containing protein [Nocardia vinacea]|uniref:TIR domain-containing protein n=1 Tax=Nocardia vinacea TaxID=96468 RepID=A0ABZ1Z7Q1_9NOCA|nr:TIR domain-containing protein [Nocardia vinacea]
MAKPVFYSFHFDQDVHRVQLIRNIDALEDNQPVSPQRWEEVRRRGRAAVEQWIDNEMNYKQAVVVLIGRYTSERSFVHYEIEQAWKRRKPLLGVYIHGLSSMDDGPDLQGKNPFDVVGLSSIPTFDPTVRSYGAIDTRATYANVRNNLVSWIGRGYTS